MKFVVTRDYRKSRTFEETYDVRLDETTTKRLRIATVVTAIVGVPAFILSRAYFSSENENHPETPSSD